MKVRSRYTVRRPVNNSYLVRERDRRRWQDLALVVLTVLPLGAALLTYAWIQVEVLETGYRITRLERELDELKKQERWLRLESARLRSPDRIDREARERLGLAPPKIDQVLFAAGDSSR